MVSRTGQDGIRTSATVNGKHGCSCMLDDLSSACPRASIEPQKGRGSNEARAPHTIHHGSSPCFASISTVTDSSGCLHYLRESPLEPWIRYLYSIYGIYIIYTKVSFGVKFVALV